VDIESEFKKAREAHRLGKVAQAILVYERILELQPKHSEALHLIGVANLQQGRCHEARAKLERAAEIAPENSKIQNNLGVALLDLGQLQAARFRFQIAADLEPNFDQAHFNLGRVYQSLGRRREALHKYRHAIEINATHGEAHNNIGAVLILLGRYQEAIDPLSRALELLPKSGEVMANLIVALELSNKTDEIAPIERQLVRVAPDLPLGKIVRASAARRDGRLREAKSLLRDVLTSKVEPAIMAKAYFELAKTLDDAGDYSSAFKACTEAKEFRSSLADISDLSPTDYLATIAARRSWTTTEKNRARRNKFEDLQNPVFFVGFPRSGTTLMEQILDSHPGFTSTGEKSPLHAMIQNSEALIGRKLILPQDFSGLKDNEIARLRAGYIRVARQVTSDDLCAQRLVDKLPLNIVELGLIDRLFPDAKILVALRDPRDVCISCYMQQFVPNNAMANFLNLDGTGSLYAAVMGLWLHYRSILEISFFEYRYEDLVRNFDHTVEQVLDFLDAPWHDAVKAYADHARTKDISTPSFAAVAKPIYKQAIGRWRNYARELEPIMPMLLPFVDEFGYEPK
jgi:tetratricopeptide (TPR) repeat protein